MTIPTLRLSVKAAAVLSCLAALSAFTFFLSRGVAVLNAAVVSLCSGAALAGILVLGSDEQLANLQRSLTARPARVFALAGVLWALFVVYSIGLGGLEPPALVFMAAYLSVPFVLLASHRGQAEARGSISQPCCVFGCRWNLESSGEC